MLTSHENIERYLTALVLLDHSSMEPIGHVENVLSSPVVSYFSFSKTFGKHHGALTCHDLSQSLEAQREDCWNLQTERECSAKISIKRKKDFKDEAKISIKGESRFQNFNPTWIVELPVLWVLANAIFVLGWQCSSLSFITLLLLPCKLDLSKKNPKRKAAIRVNLRKGVFISAIFWLQLYALTNQVSRLCRCTCLSPSCWTSFVQASIFNQNLLHSWCTCILFESSLQDMCCVINMLILGIFLGSYYLLYPMHFKRFLTKPLCM